MGSDMRRMGFACRPSFCVRASPAGWNRPFQSSSASRGVRPAVPVRSFLPFTSTMPTLMGCVCVSKPICCLTCRFFDASSHRVWETTYASSRVASDLERSSVSPRLSSRRVLNLLAHLHAESVRSPVDTQINIQGVLNHHGEAIEQARHEMLAICRSWDQEAWRELDWTKIKDLHIRDVLDERSQQAEVAQAQTCISCSKFITHVCCCFLP